ncbi:hypothetical protein LCGC14_1785890 [marine sediment metagenome]|uniref:Uncharacterized protein n=1 Tax=marine sediment metagenome TaxID=412755 RepID=A0A0F9GU65_9ZZZZ
MKKEDFILVTALNGVKVLGLRPDYFKGEAITEPSRIIITGAIADPGAPTTHSLDQVKEVFEKKIEVEIVEIPGPTEEELAEIAKQKLIEEKKAELAKLLGE